MKLLLKYSLLFLAVMMLIASTFLYYSEKTLPNFKQEERFFTSNSATLLSKDTISILTWNIGYCGLGKDMDFFYDGGKRMRTSQEITVSNMVAIAKTLSNNSAVDFMLLQEVDLKSKRSYNINQVDELGGTLVKFQKYFAPNYVVELVPMPLFNPLGKINSGLLTLTKPIPTQSIRHSYPDRHPWPEGLFMPKRCFIETRFVTKSGRELVLVNTHNSAYDDGTLRMLELGLLRKFVVAEYRKGNWVVVGGDWNQNPTGYKQINADPEALRHFRPSQIPKNFFPKGWHLAWDGKISSNRFLNQPYVEGKTMTTTIDFFLFSPNVELLDVHVLPNGFSCSDHQPVKVELVLK